MISLPVADGHTIHIRTVDEDGSVTEVRLNHGPWTRSILASIHKLTALWMDVPPGGVPVAWLATTGQPIRP